MDFVGRHAIKINRAMRMSDIGRYPASADAMLRAIPASILAVAPARAVADLLDANWHLAQASKAITDRERAE